MPAFARQLGINRTLQDLEAARAAEPLAASGPQAGGRGLAITFDDGPHPEGTPRILEILAEHHAVATFFLVGEQVAARPALAARIRENGHAVALHGHRHLPHPSRTRRQLAEDFTRAAAVIEDATGVSPAVHRPPFGVYSPASLRIARERGLLPLLWSGWGRDWRRDTSGEEIASLVARDIVPGAVILLHDADFYSAPRSHERTADALPTVLRMLKSAEIATVVCA